MIQEMMIPMMEQEQVNKPGFYKLDGELLYAPNFVLNKDFELRIEFKDTYEYPVEGWSYFESKEEAKTAFNISGN